MFSLFLCLKSDHFRKIALRMTVNHFTLQARILEQKTIDQK